MSKAALIKGLEYRLKSSATSSRTQSYWRKKMDNKHDPDGGYWDFELNEWVEYDDMGDE